MRLARPVLGSAAEGADIKARWSDPERGSVLEIQAVESEIGAIDLHSHEANGGPHFKQNPESK